MGNCPTAIRRAVRYNRIDDVRGMLDDAGKNAADVINKDHSPDCILESCSPVDGNVFYFAVTLNRYEIVQIMYDKGADIHATGYCGETCVHAAARHNAIEIARFLMEKGCDVKTTDDHGRHPVHSANMTLLSTSEMTKFLLTEAGSKEDIHLQDFDGRTPIHEAAAWGNIGGILTLLEFGADINAQSKQGNTPLHVCRKHENVWKTLVDNGADPNIANNNGDKPSPP